MNYKRFEELLRLPLRCACVTLETSALIVIGDQADALADALCSDRRFARLAGNAPINVHFGLAYFTARTPLLVGAVITEKNTTFDALSLFGWLEDNYIYEPRAELFGLTLFGEQPIMFMRDFDMDRPIEAWFQEDGNGRWLRVAGVVIASGLFNDAPQKLAADDGALIALRHTFPPDAQMLVDSLQLEHARGTALKQLLRQRRKTVSADLMSLCDGWRVLAEAVPVMRLNADALSQQDLGVVLRLAQFAA